MTWHHLAFVFSAVVLLGLASGAPAAESGDRTVCYVSVGGENRIARYERNPQTGELSERGSTQLSGAPGSLAVDRTGRLLYVALRSTQSVATLAIDPASGDLRLVGEARVADNPVYIQPDATGRLLLFASYSGNKAGVYPIGDDGVVRAEGGRVLDTHRNPHAIQIDPANRFVLVPSCGDDLVLQFVLDAERGELKPNDPPYLSSAAGAGPRHFTFHPSLPVVYVVNEKDSTVTVCDFDRQRGTLTAVQTLPTLPDGFTDRNTTADIHIAPDGRFVYASNRGHDSLAQYAADAQTGRLTPLGQVATEATPRSFAIDPTGRFVYAAGQGSGKLAAYRVDTSTGRLNRFGTYEVGSGPAWVALLTLGK